MDASRGPPRVKNKAAAPVQISAEQLLREAVDRQEEKVHAPTQRFADLEELHEYQGRKRREFESYVQRNRINMNNWMRYAAWELEQKEFKRARSIFERALDVDATAVVLWIRYIEAEMKTRNINHARNLLDRAVTILPRNDKLWYKYVYMEETLGNIAGTRQVFERWMSWEPDENAWSAYVKLEKKYGEFARARAIFERFTIVHPEAKNWIKWARFEEDYGTSDLVREVFGLAVETLGDHFMDEKIFTNYAHFEAKLKEYDRARAIYKYALDRMPRSKSQTLHKAYTTFEKQFGDRQGVEDVILSKRRVQYEEQLRENPKNYDTWIDYARLEESSGSEGSQDRTSDVYERAIAQMPPSQEKRHWRRYIYLWIFYALFVETSAADPARARQIYTKALELIPHSKFTFAKLWILAAHFEVRQGELGSARKLLGQAIGRCPKDRLFRAYIDLETKLFEFSRCRTLFTKRLEWDSANGSAWIRFAELERGLDELDRVRGIFELALGQELDMPELVWKAYIDFEEEEEEYERARGLYERLLLRTQHVKVWIAFAHFELGVPDEEGDDEGGARRVADGAGAEGAEASGEGPGDLDGEAEDDEESPPSPSAIARARTIFTRAHTLFKNQSLQLSSSSSSSNHTTDHTTNGTTTGTGSSISPASTAKDSRAAILTAWLSFEKTYGTADTLASVQQQMPKRAKKRRQTAEGEFEEYLDWVFPGDGGGDEKVGRLLEAARRWKAEKAEREAKQAREEAVEQASQDDGNGAEDGERAAVPDTITRQLQEVGVEVPTAAEEAKADAKVARDGEESDDEDAEAGPAPPADAKDEDDDEEMDGRPSKRARWADGDEQRDAASGERSSRLARLLDD